MLLCSVLQILSLILASSWSARGDYCASCIGGPGSEYKFRGSLSIRYAGSQNHEFVMTYTRRVLPFQNKNDKGETWMNRYASYRVPFAWGGYLYIVY
ncbi:hypothetical protein EDD18DRAFT_1141627 [Armillaria luteobubalina]|uniref:Secreted protein n=1 Tax=Armillaria luteobubalina TaxID=153913 RepID=A0AA39QGR8_9AGAR|nr:hypothetical protein EDD18DRAFT_1141627 [Armillaria luteobubalina]